MTELTLNVKVQGAMGGVRAGIFGGETSGAAAGIGKGIGGLAIMTGSLLVIQEAITRLLAAFTQSSGVLKGVMKGIDKTLNLILKPIGDMFGVALIPILYILRPIGTFFNTLMRPYIQKSMAAMRAGGALMQQGEAGLATESFALGFRYLVEPLVSAIVPLGASGRMDELDSQLGKLMGTSANLSENQEAAIASASNLISAFEDSGIASNALKEGFNEVTKPVSVFESMMEDVIPHVGGLGSAVSIANTALADFAIFLTNIFGQKIVEIDDDPRNTSGSRSTTRGEPSIGGVTAEDALDAMGLS